MIAVITMKEIPESQDKFRRYIEHLREKYRRRPLFTMNGLNKKLSIG